MSPLYIALTVGYAVCCVLLVVCILLQEKRSAGLGNLTGMGNAGTYWDKNKGRSREGKLELYTKLGGAVFFVFSLVLCVVR